MSNCTPTEAERQTARPLTKKERRLQRIIEKAWRYTQRKIAAWETRMPGPDFQGAVAERLTHYAPTWDKTKSSLSTWATNHAHRACQDACREHSNWRRKGPRPTVFSLQSIQDGLEERFHLHRVASLNCLAVYDPPGHLDRIDGLKSLLVGANKVERLVVLGYYWQDRTMKQIGESLGLSESRVSQIHSKLLARLRERLEAKASA